MQEGQTATNPQTGERIVFSAGQWRPMGGGQAESAPNAQVIYQGQPSKKAALDIQATEFETETAPSSLKFKRTQDLRADYDKLPAVAAYRSSIPMYATALQTQASSEGDLTLIKAYAKLTDPTTGVLTGEGQAVSDSSPYVERTIQTLRNQLDASGQFSERARIGLRQELTRLMKNRNKAYVQTRDQFSKRALDAGTTPDLVIGEHEGRPYLDVVKNYDKSIYGDSGKPSDAVTLAAPNATTTTVPVPPEMQSEIGAYVEQNKGRLNPQDFASAYNFMAQKYDYKGRIDPNNPQTLAEIEALNRGAPFGGVTPITRDLSATEQGLNEFAQSPLGVGVISATQGATGGFVDEFAGDNAGMAIKELERQNPLTSLVGQTAGALALPIGRAGSALRLGAEGAAYGAVSGAGNAEGGLADRASGAALGAGIGLGGGYFGSKLLAKLGGPKPPSNPGGAGSSKTPLEVSNEMGIDLTAGAGGGLSAKILDQTLSNVVGSAGIMNASRQKLAGQVEGALERVASNAGNATGNRGLGGSIKRGIDAGMRRATDKVSQLYESISVPANATSVLPSTLARLDEMAAKFSSNPNLARLQVSPKIAAYRDALRAKVYSQETGVLDANGNAIRRTVEEPGGLSFEDLKQFRTEIGEDIGEALIGEGTSRKELRGLYAALSADMEATAASFGPKALSEFKRANMAAQRNFDLQEKVFAPLIGKDGDNSIESVASRFRAMVSDGKSTADLNDFAKLRGAIGSQEWGDAQSAFVRMMGQPLNSEGRNFSVQTFVKTWDDMTPKAKNILFGSKGALREGLEDFTVVARKLAERDALRNTSNTAGQVVTGSLITGVGGLPTLAASAAAAAVFAKAFTSKTAAKLFVEPKFLKWATGYMRMLSGSARAGGAPNNQKQMDLLSKVAAAEPAIAADIAGLQQALQQAFASTPARMVAEPQQEVGK